MVGVQLLMESLVAVLFQVLSESFTNTSYGVALGEWINLLVPHQLQFLGFSGTPLAVH